MKHPTAIIESNQIGERTRIWAHAHILPGARIGADCNICDGVFIEGDVIVGDRVTIKCGVQLWNGVTLDNDVFVGPNATFTNDRFPRSRQYLHEPLRTVVHQGASIGANATILPGITIGEKALVGAGTVVTRSVPPHSIVVGNPGRIVGYVDAEGPAGAKLSNAASGSEQVAEVTVGGYKDLSVSGARLYRLPHVQDLRGDLTVGEFNEKLPFMPKRYFIVFDVPNAEVRGQHAHKECHQFLIAAHGSVSVVVDDTKRRQEVLLDHPSLGLLIPAGVWGVQYKYSKDAVLLVFASHLYNDKDYIRDYGEFREFTQLSKAG